MKKFTVENLNLFYTGDWEKLRPVKIWQDGSVYGDIDGKSIICVFPSGMYSDEDFEFLWKNFGYSSMPIEE